MALPAFTPDVQAAAERLHYFHPFRLGLAILVIVGADLGLLLWLGGTSASGEARAGVLVALLLIIVVRTFLPRTLSADATDIRWKRTLQPATVVARRDVAGILYVTTARPGTPRYYFVDRDGLAQLSVDRFMPARMASFAAYLGIPLRTVGSPPPTSATALSTDKANAVVGAQRSARIVAAVLTFVGLLATIGAAIWVQQSQAKLAAYQRAPLCETTSADPLACRFMAPAVVTAWDDRGRIWVRFSGAVPTIHRPATVWVKMVGGPAPDPSFAVGDTVNIEVFDGYLLAINGARTDEFNTLASNASWLLVAGAAIFLVWPAVGLVLAWKGPASWWAPRTAGAPPKQEPVRDSSAVDQEPGSISRALHRIWMAWVG